MTNSTIAIRRADVSDLSEMQSLFVDTIRAVCLYDYTGEQIEAWTSSINNLERWKNKILTQYFLAARLDNKIVGFASLEGNDYLDFLYVHKDYQRQGIAELLYLKTESEAINRGATIIHSDVSITARPFFEKKGFMAIETRTIKIQGVEIVNYRMTKSFSSGK